MKDIALVLERIDRSKNTPSEKIFGELYEFFLKICHFEKEEVFAAYQALEFYEKYLPKPIERGIKTLIDETKEVLLKRSFVLYQQIDYDKRAGLDVIFERNLGGCVGRFRMINEQAAIYRNHA